MNILFFYTVHYNVLVPFKMADITLLFFLLICLHYYFNNYNMKINIDLLVSARILISSLHEENVFNISI